MKQYTKTMLTFFVLVILIFGMYMFTDWFSRTTGYVLGEDEKVKLAQCLSGKDVEFYVSDTCPLCEAQLKIFGEQASEFLNVVECASVKDCPEGGVPAWKINGEIYYGPKSFKELSGLGGCELN